MRVWVSRYALTHGIEELEVEQCTKAMVREQGPFARNFHGDDWHRDRSAAEIKAEDMRTKKIASLEKQIAKLRKLRFS